MIRPLDVSREGLKFRQWIFLSFLFYQYTALSCRAVDGHQSPYSQYSPA